MAGGMTRLAFILSIGALAIGAVRLERSKGAIIGSAWKVML